MITHPSKHLSNLALFFFLFTLLLSGAVLAVGLHVEYQDPVLNAQTMSGLVTYPKDNPYYVSQMNAWSLVNQLTAAAMRFGCSEEFLSTFLCACGGAVSFCALGLLTLSFSNNIGFSMVVPFFMYTTELVGFPASRYVTTIMGGLHVNGIIGIFSGLLAFGFLGVGRIRTSAFILGLSISLHTSMGLFYLVSLAIWHFIVRKKLQNEHYRKLLTFLVIGFVCSGVSFIIHKLFYAIDVKPLTETAIKPLLHGFLENYDYHRDLTNHGFASFSTLVAALTFSISMLDLKFSRSSTEYISTAALLPSMSLAVALFVTLDVYNPSDYFKILMSWRYFNVLNVCCIPLTFAILCRNGTGKELTGLVSLTLLILTAIFIPTVPSIVVYTLFTLFAGYVLMPANSFRPFTHHIIKHVISTAFLTGWFVTTIFPALTSASQFDYLERFPFSRKSLRELSILSERPGMLLISTKFGRDMQLRTGRPILIDTGDLSVYAYVPKALPGLNDILTTVYGIDLLKTPPEQQKHFIGISGLHRAQWESRSRSEWLNIAKKYNVRDVLTPPDWNLHLPQVISTTYYSLYEIRTESTD